MSCKKAIGIAEEMKQLFKEKIELNVYTTDSPEAMKYSFRSATNVLLEEELVPLDTALDATKMEGFLLKKLS